MKNIFCLLILFCFSAPIFGQSISSAEVPAPVTKSFSKKFKGVSGTAWEKKENNFIASFSLDAQRAKAEFDPTGKWVSTLTNVDAKLLPAEAAKYVKTNFKKAKIESVQQKQVPKEVYFVVIVPETIEGKVYKSELVFAEDGSLSTSKIPEQVEKAHDAAGSKGKKVKADGPKDDDLQATDADSKDKKISQKELPTKANDYIKANYKGSMDMIKESWQMKRDGKTVYKVKMKKEGQKELDTLYFNLNGEKIDIAE